MIEHNHSIDRLEDKIHNAKTKQYFQEVVQTYYAGAYRSCVVTLYSVVICDLVFKLEELSDVYNDSTANAILEEIKAKQVANPRSPDWEKEIIESIKAKTSMLELFAIDEIYHLQSKRHLSAHPVLTASSVLHTPSKETVTALLINMLNYVLTIPAFLSQNIVNTIIKDISDNKDRLLGISELERYLDSKYFRKVKQEVYNKLFKVLWKFIFVLDNDECNENREVNTQTLLIVYEKNRDGIEKYIRENGASFEFNSDFNTKLFLFLFECPNIYSCLSISTKTLIIADVNSTLEYKLIAWFRYSNFEDYVTMIDNLGPFTSKLFKGYVTRVLKLFGQFGKKEASLDLSIRIFSDSYNYTSADTRFKYLIKEQIEDFAEEHLIRIIEAINTNSQISDRNQARGDNAIVKNALVVINPAFDFSQYARFWLP